MTMALPELPPSERRGRVRIPPGGEGDVRLFPVGLMQIFEGVALFSMSARSSLSSSIALD